MITCPICSKQVKEGGLGGHKYLAHTELGRLHAKKANKGRRLTACVPWNKGLTKETDIRVKSYSVAKEGKTFISKEGRRALADKAKERKLGGYTPTGGRGKKGWYNGYWCDSSWELAWIVYQLDHNVSFIRNTEKFEYIHQGKQKLYIPDFILASGMYVEVKGYLSDIVTSKLAAFPYPIEIWDKTKMQPILKYMKDKYGAKFTYLYMEGRSTGC